MKKIYWRPSGLPLSAYLLIVFISLGGFVSVERFQKVVLQPYYREKLAAARLALAAMEIVKKERLKQRVEIDSEVDPAESGLIGEMVTQVTSEIGDLEAKQTSINPNFAAVVVSLLKKAKVKEGDTVAVGFTGSFPALDISVCAAIETLKLKPIIISTASSSQWGANDPDFLWIDMERLLNENRVFSFRSVAASMGGRNDHGKGMPEEGRRLLLKGIERSGLTLIESDTLRENINSRMKIYFCCGSPKAFINVGGSVISVGKYGFRKKLKSGLIESGPTPPGKVDSVANRFMSEGIPVIHIDKVETLARHYGFPLRPTKIPPVGEGKIYSRMEYNSWLAGAVLLAILLTLYIFSRSDRGFRIMQAMSRKEDQNPPELMI